MKLEKRFFTNEIGTRSGENDTKVIYGYAAKYDNRSKLLIEGGKEFYEIIRQGAFIDGVQNSMDVVMVLDHDPKKLLARTKSKTLALRSDNIGLYFEFFLPDTTLGRDTFAMIERGDISELSFAFYLRDIEAKWSKLNDGTLLREISNFKYLKDVSLLQTNAAYHNTVVSIDARELEQIERGFEQSDKELNKYFENLKYKFNN